MSEKATLRVRVFTGDPVRVFIYNSQTERDMEIKLASLDFSRRIAECSRSSWLQTLGHQLIDGYVQSIATANITYCIILLGNVNESPVNARVV